MCKLVSELERCVACWTAVTGRSEDVTQSLRGLSLSNTDLEQMQQPLEPIQLHAVAGLELAVASLRELIGWPVLYAEEGAAIGVSWPKGMLLHGPPGCGKTLVARSVAAEFDAEVHEISAASVFGAYTVQESLSANCEKLSKQLRQLPNLAGLLSSFWMKSMLCVHVATHSTNTRLVLWLSCSLSWTAPPLKKGLTADYPL